MSFEQILMFGHSLQIK